MWKSSLCISSSFVVTYSTSAEDSTEGCIIDSSLLKGKKQELDFIYNILQLLYMRFFLIKMNGEKKKNKIESGDKITI